MHGVITDCEQLLVISNKNGPTAGYDHLFKTICMMFSGALQMLPIVSPSQKEWVGPGGQVLLPTRPWPGGGMKPSLLSGSWNEVHGECEGLSSLQPTVQRHGYWLDKNAHVNRYCEDIQLVLWAEPHLEL